MDFQKRVQCINTGEVFDSSKQAGEKYGIKSYRDINKCCNGKRKSAGVGQDKKPLKWRYISIEEAIKNNQEQGNETGQENSEAKKLKASDFDLNFAGRQGKKNKAFLMKYATLEYLDYDEIDKLADRMSHRLSATEKSMRREWKNKHYDMSEIDKIMHGV
jgi:hypothetical protein